MHTTPPIGSGDAGTPVNRRGNAAHAGRGRKPYADQPPAAAKDGDAVEISDEARALAEASRKNQNESSTKVDIDIKVEVEVEVDVDAIDSVWANGKIETQEGRAEMGTNYDAILAGLRKQYDEPEALRRFDDYMRSEGFEPIEETDDSALRANGYWTKGGLGATNLPFSLASGKVAEYLIDTGQFTADNSSNFHLQSHLYGLRMDDGSIGIRAESLALYAVDDTADQEEVIRRVVEERNSAYADLAGLDKYLSTRNTSVTGVSTDLASRMQELMTEAGVAIGENDEITFRLTYGEDGTATGVQAFGTFGVGDVAVLNGVLGREAGEGSDLLQEFVAMYESVDFADLSELEYDDGARTATAHQYRSFSLRADNPDAMVMTDDVYIHKTGFAYRRTATETYIPDSDTYHVMTKGDGTGQIDLALIAAIDEAVKTGGQVESTITNDELAANWPRGRVNGDHLPDWFTDGYPKQGQYLGISDYPLRRPNRQVIDIAVVDQDFVLDTSSVDMEPVELKVAPASDEKRTGKAKETEVDAEVAYADEKRQTKRTRLQSFIDSLRAKGTPEEVSILESLSTALSAWRARR
ncbi:MAG: hypothetical protein LUC93_02620 [Planctomycetaceae bacterium]|nr:hypothetical protein [Planctomycetaceae bacterium]